MSMRLLRAFAGALAAAVLLPSCMVLDLDGDVATRTCASDADCAHLDANAAADACMRHRCTSESLCRAAIVDADGDGSPAARCTGSDTDDCDDAAPDVGPGAVETSNDRDDDCDGFVDEVVVGDGDESIRYSSLQRIWASAPTRSSTSADGSVALIEPNTAGVGASSLLELETQGVALPIVRSLTSSEVPLLARSISVSRLSTDAFVVAVVPDGACQRVSLGLATRSVTPSARAVARFVDNAGVHFERGVADASGDTCAKVASGDPPRLARAPSLLMAGTRGVVVWVSADAGVSECTAIANAPVLLHAFAADSSGITGTTGAATLLGLTDDASPPALVFVPGYGVVAAFMDDDALVLVRVHVDSGLMVTTELIRSPVAQGGVVASHPAIALGPTVDGLPSVGVLLSVGTCEVGDPRLHRFVLGGGPLDPAPTRRLDEVPTLLSGGESSGDHDRGHALVYAQAPGGYWAAWFDATTLRLRHIEGDGTVLGEAPRAITAARLASIVSIGLLGPAVGDAPSLTLNGVATVPDGAHVVFERTFVFP